MKTPARVLIFGFLSGLFWSLLVIAFFFHFHLLGNRTDIPGLLVAGIISGVITSTLLVPLVTRCGGGVGVLLGLISLPLGSFVFGFNFALVSRFIPALTSSTHAPVEPWTLGFYFAAASLASVFTFVFLPLAVINTHFLRTFLNDNRKVDLV